ncbi:DNA polymerase III subunit beta [Candidatus Saccharibacteria bacterium]|nr:MAG: DNA polymerase III subunit beta [Candidatus Saccharibacteria bacterium]
MKVQVTQENLAKALSSAQRITTSKAGLPILNNILIKTDENRLLVASTNLEIASTHHIGAKVIKDGSITVPARLISEFVSSLPKGQIDIETDGSKLNIKSGNYKSTINGIDSEEFPELPSVDQAKATHYSIDAHEFKKSVGQTVFASSNDSTRPILTGVYWHSKAGELFLVATDGYRLAEKALLKTKSELSAIVPSSILNEVLRLLNDNTEAVEALFDETQVMFKVDESELISQLIDGKYPDYEKLIPSVYQVKTEVSAEEFSRITKIASLFSRDSGNSITIKVDEASQKISIQSVASEVGENTSDIEASIKGSGQVSLNARYLTEALSVVEGEEVEFKFNGKLAPCVLESKDKKTSHKHVIMPIKS